MLKSIAFFEPLLRKEKKNTIVEEAQRREKNEKVRSSFSFGRGSCREREMELMSLIWCGWTIARFDGII